MEATLKKMLLKRFNQVLNPRPTALCQQEEVFRDSGDASEPLGLADTKKGSERRVNQRAKCAHKEGLEKQHDVTQIFPQSTRDVTSHNLFSH